MSATVATFFVLYLLIMIAVGIWASARRHREALDYDVAKRERGTVVTALSASASSESAWVLLGMVGAAYSTGVNCLWILGGGLLGYALNWSLVAPQLGRLPEHADLRTLPQTLAYGASGRWARTIRSVAALIAVVFLLGYLAAQLNASGKAFESLFGFPYWLGAALGLIIVGSYTLRGGMRSVGAADSLQAVMMVVATIVLPLVVLHQAGGPSAMLSKLTEIDPHLTSATHGQHGVAAFAVIVSWVALGLAYPGQPHVIDKFLAARKAPGVFVTGRVVAIVWFQLLYLGAVTLGLAARVAHHDVPEIVQDPERTLPVLAAKLLTPFLAGLSLAAIIAAMASTADGLLFAATTCFVRDLLGDRPVAHRTGVALRMGTLAVLGIAAAVFAMTKNRLIFTFVLYAWTVLGASFGPAMLYTLHVRNRAPAATLAGILVGLLSSVAMGYGPYQLLGAFSASLAAILLVHLVAPKSGRITHGI